MTRRDVGSQQIAAFKSWSRHQIMKTKTSMKPAVSPLKPTPKSWQRAGCPADFEEAYRIPKWKNVIIAIIKEQTAKAETQRLMALAMKKR